MISEKIEIHNFSYFSLILTIYAYTHTRIHKKFYVMEIMIYLSNIKHLILLAYRIYNF